jgi:hypothetical protein
LPSTPSNALSPDKGSRLPWVLGRLLGANVSLYVGMTRLAVGYLQEVVDSLQTLGGSQGERGSDSTPSQSQSATGSGPLVLEAESGHAAVGAFMVQNGLDARVSTPIEASVFTDGAGRSVNPEIVFQPPDVTLEPGEKALVKVVVRIGDEIKAGKDYIGAVTIPGLANRRLELLLRSTRPNDRGPELAKKNQRRTPRRVASRRARPRERSPGNENLASGEPV